MKHYFNFNDSMAGKRRYSDAVKVGNTIYLSGITSTNERGELIGKGSIEDQTRQVILNLKGVLGKLGGTLKDVVKLTIYLTRLEDRPGYHKVRADYFGTGDELPAASLVVITTLADKDFLLELDAIAVLEQHSTAQAGKFEMGNEDQTAIAKDSVFV